MSPVTPATPATPGTPAAPCDVARLAHGPDWANRIALAPMTNTQSHDDGTLSEEEHDWLVARGRGGFAMVTTCAAYVAPAGRAWHGQLGISSDEHLPGLRRLAAGLHATGARCAVQLHHGGRRADPDLVDELTGPFDDPETGTRVMSTHEVESLVADFVAAAVRAQRAGFDGVEVHGAHGYVLEQFLDPAHDRTDRYGGTPEARMRVLTEILTGIRESTGPEFQIGLRLAPEASDLPLADGLRVMRELLAGGAVDYLDVSMGDVRKLPHDAVHEDARRLLAHVTALPRGDTVLGVSGNISSAADVAWCLDRGADAVFVATAAILHHDFADRVLADADFVARPRPVPPQVLATEGVSASFLAYLDAGWDDIVAS